MYPEMRALAVKLRKTADMLDELYGLFKRQSPVKKVQAKRIERPHKEVVKKRNHWTQLPKNRERMLKIMAKANKARKVNGAN